jgi:hypothetical protein
MPIIIPKLCHSAIVKLSNYATLIPFPPRRSILPGRNRRSIGPKPAPRLARFIFGPAVSPASARIKLAFIAPEVPREAGPDHLKVDVAVAHFDQPD